MQKAFEVMYVRSQKPPGAALFEQHDDKCETNSFEEYIYESSEVLRLEMEAPEHFTTHPRFN